MNDEQTEETNLPTPRTSPSAETYKPKEIPTRAGSMDAFQLPSHGRPRVRPLILASGVSGAPLGR